VLRQRDAKLAEAQQAQADVIRKQRELDDAKRELHLTVKNRVQAGLTALRDKAKQETARRLLVWGFGRRKSRSPRCSVTSRT
jgi:hypothetical protein